MNPNHNLALVSYGLSGVSGTRCQLTQNGTIQDSASDTPQSTSSPVESTTIHHGPTREAPRSRTVIFQSPCQDDLIASFLSARDGEIIYTDYESLVTGLQYHGIASPSMIGLTY